MSQVATGSANGEAPPEVRAAPGRRSHDPPPSFAFAPQRTWSRTLAVWGLVALCLTVSVVTVGAMSRARQKKPVAVASAAPVITVSTVPPRYETLSDDLVATGSIRAVDPLSVGPEVNGLRITSVLVEEGAQVRRGQVLARLNPAVLQAQMQQNRARFQGSLATVSKSIQPNRPQELAVLEAASRQARAAEEQEQANLRQAQTNLEMAQKTARRYTEVLDEGFVTAQETQDRTTEVARNQAILAAAQHRLNGARFATLQARERLALALAGGRAEDVQLARSSSQEVAANMDLLQAQLDQTVIRAPDDGLVLQRDAHLGDIVSTGKTLFTIARLSQMELRAQVPEVDLNRVKVGDVALTQVGGKEVRGRVWLVSPAVDPNSRLGTVRVMLEPPSSRHTRILPGMFARVSLRLGQYRALVVPSSALMGENDNYFLFVLQEGRARKLRVTPGSRVKELVEIRQGLSTDARVIIKGAGFLSDGDAVAVSEK